MKTIYEKFEELADAMREGGGILHVRNCPYNDKSFQGDTSIAWQRGVRDFAEWLDFIGAKIEMTDYQEDFYDFASKKYNTK